MDALLWKLSTAAQVASALMIAISFPLVTRASRRAERRWWTRAWIANLAALAVAVVFWVSAPSERVGAALRGCYVLTKTASLLWFVQGARAARRDRAPLFGRGASIALLAGATFVGVTLLTSIDRLGVGEQLLIAIALGYCAIALARTRETALVWLAVGCGVRASAALIESLAYAAHLATDGGPLAATLATVLAAHSFFDAGAEWLMALGGVHALSERRHHELRDAADRDALTGLANRRALPRLLDALEPSGGVVLFFDVDEFKVINDTLGHHAGDQCLREFASALDATFAAHGRAVRYAGDEFVVLVESRMSDAMIAAALDALTARLGRTSIMGRRIEFSAGWSAVAPGGDADAALREADRAMYGAKAARRTLREASRDRVAALS